MIVELGPALVWQRFVGACQADAELGPYVGTILALGATVLTNPARNIEVLDRIFGHLNAARESP